MTVRSRNPLDSGNPLRPGTAQLSESAATLVARA